MVVSGCNSHLCNYSVVSNALFKLKARKADGTHNLMSDALINSSPSMAVHISLLFSAILIHGVLPYYVLLATLIPIFKSTKKCLNAITNCQAIALGIVLSKLLYIIITYMYVTHVIQ